MGIMDDDIVLPLQTVLTDHIKLARVSGPTTKTAGQLEIKLKVDL